MSRSAGHVHLAGSHELRALIRPVLVAPGSRPADSLLEEMRASRRQLAVVVDEYGGTAGIVTLENLIEALVGRIAAEPDGGLSAPDIDPDADGSMLLDGLTRLDELEELTGVPVVPDLRDEVDTLGGLVMASLGRIPHIGDVVAFGPRSLRVEGLDRRRVTAVRLLAPTQPDRVAEERTG